MPPWQDELIAVRPFLELSEAALRVLKRAQRYYDEHGRSMPGEELRFAEKVDHAALQAMTDAGVLVTDGGDDYRPGVFGALYPDPWGVLEFLDAVIRDLHRSYSPGAGPRELGPGRVTLDGKEWQVDS